MDILQLKKYLYNNDELLFKQLGYLTKGPVSIMNFLIRHYQWNYQNGKIKNNDMELFENQSYKEIFITMINDFDLSQNFLIDFLNALKIAYNHKTKIWEKDLIIDILIQRKFSVRYDILAFYTLLASTFDQIEHTIKSDEVCNCIDMSKDKVRKLLKIIIDQNFADQVIDNLQLHRKINKSMYEPQ